MTPYDVVIVGGGVTGAALAYVLSRYVYRDGAPIRTALIEKEGAPAQVNSHRLANSQTLHVGDIETHYSREVASRVRADAELLAAYLDRHVGERLARVAPKMVLGVGAAEVALLLQRYREIRDIFPRLRFVQREALAALEPMVVEGRDPAIPIAALWTDHGYVVDFGLLTESFLRHAAETGAVEVILRTAVRTMTRTTGGFRLTFADQRSIDAGTVSVTAGAMCLPLAHALGYGRDLVILPVAGNFYRSLRPGILRGKVYAVQVEWIPFVATHGDPEVHDPMEVRFGPTTVVVPILERRRWRTIREFLAMFLRRPRGVIALLRVLAQPHFLRFALRQFVTALPIIGPRLVLGDIQKLIPTMHRSDLERASGGGLRPQLVDVTSGTFHTDGRIVGDRITFTVTPSPGASTCLAAAERDAALLAEWLGATFDRERFRAEHARADGLP